MSISSPFIHRPVATTLLVVAIALAGAIGYKFLPVSPLPQVEFPTISVGSGLPGASPDTMASSVATPLERQFGRIAGITEMTSTSSLGSTNITIQFDLNRNIDAAARDVQAAINAARGQLPANLPNNPSYRKVNPADAPIMILTLTSDIVERYSPLGADLGTFVSIGLSASIFGIAFDAAGDLYVANYAEGNIHRFSPAGDDLGVFASTAPVRPRDLVIIPLGAAPTVKEECKDDGWQSFDSFKNQGDCIQLVNTGK